MYDLDLISTYLHFGYLPSCQENTAGFLAGLLEGGNHPRSPGGETAKLVSAGVEALRGAFRDAVDKTDAEKIYVLPLSGGLDSRAILGGLLENLDSSEIQAATFGTPGTWDYEIGRRVARTVGVSSEAMDLTADDRCWNTADLLRTAAQLSQPVWVFDAHINRQIPERFGRDCVYWSGFMGEALTGSHLPAEDSGTWDEAKSRFIRTNRLARSLTLTPPDFEPGVALPAIPFIDPNLLCFDDQMDFGVRQQCKIKHVVLRDGYEYQTPFLQSKWSSFILNVPRRYREKQALYQEILKTAYPKLMSLPTKANVGLPLGASRWRKMLPAARLYIHAAMKRYAPGLDWGVSPTINYIDFDRALRGRCELKQVAREHLHHLKERGVVDWLDIDEIWQRHQNKRSNYGVPLLLLASLEIHLKAGRFHAVGQVDAVSVDATSDFGHTSD